MNRNLKKLLNEYDAKLPSSKNGLAVVKFKIDFSDVDGLRAKNDRIWTRNFLYGTASCVLAVGLVSAGIRLINNGSFPVFPGNSGYVQASMNAYLAENSDAYVKNAVYDMRLYNDLTIKLYFGVKDGESRLFYCFDCNRYSYDFRIYSDLLDIDYSGSISSKTIMGVIDVVPQIDGYVHVYTLRESMETVDDYFLLTPGSLLTELGY